MASVPRATKKKPARNGKGRAARPASPPWTALLAHLRGPAVIAASGRITALNPAAARLFHAKPLSALVGASLDRLVLPEDRPRFNGFYTRQRRSTVPQVFETSIERNGKRTPVALAVHRMAGWRDADFLILPRTIPQHRRSIGELQDELDLMRQVFDAVPERLFVKDREGRYLRVNRAQAESMGISADDFIGLTTQELARRLGAERTAGNIRDEDSQVLTTGERLVLPDMPRLMAGGRRWSRMIKGPLRDSKGRIAGIIGLGIDVTERRAMEESLRDINRRLELSERRFRAVLSNAPGVIFQAEVGADPWPAFTFVSEGVKDLTGVAADDILRDPTLLRGLLLPEAELDLLQILGKNWTEPSPVTYEFRIRRRDGETRWVWTRLLLHRADGKQLVLDGVALDITERKRLEGELRRAERMEAIGQLTSGVAHQFNNLLAIISGNAELLDQSAGGGPARTSVAQIQSAVDRGSRLVRNLQSFSSIQRLLAASTQVNELVNDMYPLIQSTLGEGFSFALDLEAGLPPVSTDMLRLSSAFLGLVMNAKEAMPAGGEIRVNSRRVTVSAEEARPRQVAPGLYVQLEVADSGIGMSPEVLARAVDPLFSTKDANEPAGLGLSSAHGLVRQSGGFLTIASGEGAGTVVTLMFPANGTGASVVELDTP